MSKNGYVLITGASSGIGFELAKIFAQNKYNLYLISLPEEGLDETSANLAKKYNVKVKMVEANLADENTPQLIYDLIISENIKIDILINNAGFGNFGVFYENNIQKEKDMINVNIKALTEFTHLFLKKMIEQNKGKILNIASTAAFQPGPYFSVYYASKAFVLSFSQAIRYETKNTSVQICTLCPGPTNTNFENKANAEKSKLFKHSWVMTPDKVAKKAYKGLRKNNSIIIPGFINKLLTFSTRFLPRKLVLKTVAKIQMKKNKASK